MKVNPQSPSKRDENDVLNQIEFDKNVDLNHLTNNLPKENH